jgi:hypothetical protein
MPHTGTDQLRVAELSFKEQYIKHMPKIETFSIVEIKTVFMLERVKENDKGHTGSRPTLYSLCSVDGCLGSLSFLNFCLYNLKLFQNKFIHSLSLRTGPNGPPSPLPPIGPASVCCSHPLLQNYTSECVCSSPGFFLKQTLLKHSPRNISLWMEKTVIQIWREE